MLNFSLFFYESNLRKNSVLSTKVLSLGCCLALFFSLPLYLSAILFNPFPPCSQKKFFLLLLQDFAKMNHVGRSIILGSSNLIWFKFLHLPFFNLSRSIRLRIQYALNCYRSVGQKRKFKIGSFCFWPFKKGLFSTQIVCMVLVRVKRIFQKSAAIWWEILKIGRREKNFLTNNFRGKEEKVV